ncbi:MAG: acetyl-CoA C-acyltransferase [Salinibacterium sp.]|nr:acetyl-CoA C-acyltransferase [Salinibacterium sp.]
MAGSVIIAGARTPIGRLSGGLSEFTAPELGGKAIAAALERAGITADQVDAVIMGNVLQAGVGPGPARQAAVAGGISLDVPSTTINKLCLSGLTAIAMADQAIASGQHEIVVAGGMESMTNAPHLVRGVRRGISYGSRQFEDAIDRDGLIGPIEGITMGAATEQDQRRFHFTREQQDAFAAESHRRAHSATTSGRFAAEIVPVSTRKGVVIEVDEGIRPDTTVETLARLRPAFAPDGTITAGSASQLSDGAAAVIVMSKEKARELGLSWIAEIVAYGTVAGPDASLLHQPANAIRDALRRHGSLAISDIDLFEMNEAFASVTMASTAELGVEAALVNVNGGAIAVGHPIGMSGARVVLDLALELGKLGGTRVGAAALCGGGGQGDALLIRVGGE